MKKIISFTIILMMTAFLTGCPKKQTIAEEAKAPAVDAEKQKAEARAKAEAEARAKAEAETRAKAEAAKTKEEAAVKAKEEAAVNTEAKDTKEAAAKTEAKVTEEFRLEDIHFDFDKSDIKEKDRDILKGLSDWLSKNKSAKIQIEGHCDERGTNEYNLALGERRAHSAKQYLVTLGVAKNRISTISYGEEKPLCAEANEDCWAKNRRGHFVIQEKK